MDREEAQSLVAEHGSIRGAARATGTQPKTIGRALHGPEWGRGSRAPGSTGSPGSTTSTGSPGSTTSTSPPTSTVSPTSTGSETTSTAPANLPGPAWSTETTPGSDEEASGSGARVVAVVVVGAVAVGVAWSVWRWWHKRHQDGGTSDPRPSDRVPPMTSTGPALFDDGQGVED